jgi:hypothetical protein
MSRDDIPAPRFLLVLMVPVLQHFAVKAYLERGRRLESLDTETLRKAYPVATRRLLENRGDNAQWIAWLDVASELELRGKLGPFVSELAKQLKEHDPEGWAKATNASSEPKRSRFVKNASGAKRAPNRDDD